MHLRPTVLCPIDFSDSSRVALRYAAAVAEHLHAGLLLVTVSDPLTAESAGLTLGSRWLTEEYERELRRFFAHTLEGQSTAAMHVEVAVATGKPAPEILRVASDRGCDLIVMSTRGLTGMRKLFFGSTTERVLRETSLPVLVTPPAEVGPLSPQTIKSVVRRILVPVDLATGAAHQMAAARRIAEGLGVPLLIAHVIEPVRSFLPAKIHLPNADTERRVRADKALDALMSTIPPGLKPETLVAYGDPAEEIAKIARDRNAGLIIMGLHASTPAGPRMGSVTYRVLCVAPTLMLAVPPVSTSAFEMLDEPVGVAAPDVPAAPC